VHDVSMDAAVFARNVRRLAEFDEVVLAGEALPAFRDDPRRIDAAGRQVVRAAGRRIAGAGAIGNGLIGAVRVLAIYGAGHTEVEGQRNLFDGVREVLGDVGIAAGCVAVAAGGGAVGRTAGVVDHVNTGGLIAGIVRFDDVPVEQRKGLVEAVVPLQIGARSIRQAAVAVANGGVGERNSGLFRLGDAVLVLVHEDAQVDVGLPLLDGNFSHIHHVAAPDRDRYREAVDDLVVPLIE